MKLIKPRALEFGDTIGVIAPASPPKEARYIDPAIAALKTMGFKVKLGSAARKRTGFLAGSDHERADDINRMFADKQISGILCLRGGYGAARTLDKLNYGVIKRNPKILCGFSDITALHLAIFKKSGLMTFHGPTLLTLLGPKERSDYTLTSWLRSVMVAEPYGDVRRGMPKKYSKARTLLKGTASGALVGGNLSIITSLVGSEYLPSFSGKILFLEDVNEAPYRVDRALTQLLLSGALRGVKGIAIGDFGGTGDFESVFRDRLSSLKVPVITGLPIGHIDDFATVPQGALARIEDGTLSIIERALST